MNVSEPDRLSSVTMKDGEGKGGGSQPVPCKLGSFGEAHSASQTFPPIPKPVTVTVTCCPLTSPVAGVTVTFGLIIVTAGGIRGVVVVVETGGVAAGPDGTVSGPPGKPL
jgi:hypothetical protein